MNHSELSKALAKAMLKEMTEQGGIHKAFADHAINTSDLEALGLGELYAKIYRRALADQEAMQAQLADI